MQNVTKNPPYLSVVIPAYNEEKRIAESLATVGRYLEQQSFTFEVLVVDDGSTDRTAEICRELAADRPWLKLLHYPVNRGKGYAVRRGMLDATGDYLLMCDADLATPIEELNVSWQHISDDVDIVIASRPLKESQLIVHQPIYRELAGRAFNLLVQAVAVSGIHDTQCGFKLFRREAAKEVFPLCFLDGFGFDIEVLYVARRLGFSIEEIPVRWYHKPGSKVNLLRDGLRMLCDLFKVRLRHRGLAGRLRHSERSKESVASNE